MSKFKIEVTRYCEVYDSAIIDVEADNLEEAKIQAIEIGKDYPHYFVPYVDDDIKYDIGDYAEEVGDDAEPERYWGDND